MIHEIEIGRENQDGADQGFIGGHFPDLLDQPMFHPPLNGTQLQGNYRLPLGYQMDASYYCKFEIPSMLTEQSSSYFTCYNDCLLLILQISNSIGRYLVDLIVSLHSPVLHG